MKSKFKKQYINIEASDDGFSQEEIDDIRKKMEENNIPKPWHVKITDVDTMTQVIFRF